MITIGVMFFLFSAFALMTNNNQIKLYLTISAIKFYFQNTFAHPRFRSDPNVTCQQKGEEIMNSGMNDVVNVAIKHLHCK